MIKVQHSRPHLIFFILYSLCNFVLWYLSDNGGLFIMLVWNAFLSFLPVLFSQFTVSSLSNHKRFGILWALLWIIFWPNTFYMATDIVHFTGDAFFQVVKGIPYVEQPQIIYSDNLLLWSKGVIIVLGILYGIMNGINSEMIFENILINKYGKGKNLLLRFICSILGGIAIYIGRFLRFNSWNIFNPIRIVTGFQLSGHEWRFVCGFVGIFAAFILCILSFAKAFYRQKNKIDTLS
ncbi:hypothetical protein CAFE_24870 [Caprobacter fermentans]|uniref:DUF1361 domain-containing protein n=1 Tax=Caproicibacter fermentans TaxID=2576756 RepID=A0A6N8I148_9FIRM|nr:DUF1361 domain-containing protein [Caproicibacter fermentans]MVB11762.1 hypothetical protein [Caproicibacter fermentans]QNK40203.1 DUF1361 domain-containing protein [Caproicibacter fermentans]